VKWYKFSNRPGLAKGEFDLVDVLDLSDVPGFATKPAAAAAAVSLSLRTWRHVQF